MCRSRARSSCRAGAARSAWTTAWTKSSSEWKVYDVNVDGVSLVTTYRSTFADEIRQSGIDGLIKSLQEKNAPPPPGASETEVTTSRRSRDRVLRTAVLRAGPGHLGNGAALLEEGAGSSAGDRHSCRSCPASPKRTLGSGACCWSGRADAAARNIPYPLRELYREPEDAHRAV